MKKEIWDEIKKIIDDGRKDNTFNGKPIIYNVYNTFNGRIKNNVATIK